ncbi:MAG: low affinity iron permease family protein [Ferruginibacter sp.]
MKKKVTGSPGIVERFSCAVNKAAGSSAAFVCAFIIVIAWAVTGPVFHYSETWQLVINTGTTIITFLMVFLIQKSQNKDALAIQLKLNELVASNELASNRLVNVENMTEDELKVIQKYYGTLSELTKHAEKLQESHSIEEAKDMAAFKERSRSRIHKEPRKTATAKKSG